MASAAAAQQPSFVPDDFVDPEQIGPHAFFVSRLVAGVARDLIDEQRPLHQDTSFLHVANSFYWKRFQFDYERTEIAGERESDPGEVQVCFCDNRPVYYPAPPAANATPAAPLPGAKDTLQAAWYQTASRGEGRLPVTLRYRLSWSRQAIETRVVSFATGEQLARFRGNEQSIHLDADTHVRIAGRDVFGSLRFGRTTRSGTVDDRAQSELTYTARFPAAVLRRVLVRPTITVGGVSNRGGTAVNVVSPAFEAFWHDDTTRANLHLVWRPHTTRSGAGWTTTNEIVFFADRALFVKLFRGRAE